MEYRLWQWQDWSEFCGEGWRQAPCDLSENQLVILYRFTDGAMNYLKRATEKGAVAEVINLGQKYRVQRARNADGGA